MNICAVSYSVSRLPKNLEDWERRLWSELKLQLQRDCKLILYPELFLLELSAYFPGTKKSQLEQISRYVHSSLLPDLKSKLGSTDVFLCLGSGPRESSGVFYNSAPVFYQGDWTYQDKVHQTPWETDFTPGRQINIYQYAGLKVACLICFDVEQPGIAVALKQEGVNFLLVPSATADRNGSNRINRCASGRAVELGAAVLTAPLVGKSDCDLIDASEGRQGFFLPAQLSVPEPQESYSIYSTDEQVLGYYTVDPAALLKLKTPDDETKPYLSPDRPITFTKIGV